MDINIPNGALSVLNRFAQNGCSAYIVGGCVRDAVMGRECNDWDITTSALPWQTKDIFSDKKVIETGISHGTVTVIADNEPYEITTFRADGEYSDHRHADEVIFSDSIEDDLSRRDFTVNAMAYNPNSGFIDLFGGIDDINSKIIRAVGDAKKRFEEDALRILRGLRFAAQLGFEIETCTKRAMFECKHLIVHLSAERIYQEICRLIQGQHALDVMLEYGEIIAEAVPEIASSIGFDQKNKHHIYNVWDHTAYSVANSPFDPVCRLVMFLHDCGKPDTFTVDESRTGHFYGHSKVSAAKAEVFFERSGAGNDIKNRVCKLIYLHDSDIFGGERSIRRWLGKLGEPDLRRLIDIKRADNLSQAPQYRGRLMELESIKEKVDRIVAQKSCVNKSMLDINGNDIMALGYQGVQIGYVLDELLDAVIESRCNNTKDELIRYAANLGRRD